MDKTNLKNKKQGSYLTHQIQSGDFASFMLFVGQEGTGKTKVVEDFASAILCENGNGEPCLECGNCKLFRSGSHPDFIRLGASGAIKIPEIRELQRALYLKPYKASHKVAVIEGAHLMTEESANAVLKILEEPPENSIIILTAPDKKLLPDTVVSRSQVVSFGTADGILDKGSKELNQDILYVLKKRPIYEKFLLVQKYSKEKSLTFEFLNILEGTLRDMALDKVEISGYSKREVVSNLELIQQSREYLKSNLSSKFVLENIVLNT